MSSEDSSWTSPATRIQLRNMIRAQLWHGKRTGGRGTRSIQVQTERSIEVQTFNGLQKCAPVVFDGDAGSPRYMPDSPANPTEPKLKDPRRLSDVTIAQPTSSTNSNDADSHDEPMHPSVEDRQRRRDVEDAGRSRRIFVHMSARGRGLRTLLLPF